MTVQELEELLNRNIFRGDSEGFDVEPRGR